MNRTDSAAAVKIMSIQQMVLSFQNNYSRKGDMKLLSPLWCALFLFYNLTV